VRVIKHKRSGRNVAVAMLGVALAAAIPALAEVGAVATKERAQEKRGEVDAELAKKTQNPIADLASLPFQYNYDENIGPTEDGKKSVLNIQPVIPFSLNQDWIIISRTIVPLIDQKDSLPNGAADESGLGDIVQSLFFSPKKQTERGWTWGVGPVFLLPTASKDILGSEKWGIGPTAVALKQEHGWTVGVLANHIWSVAGDNDRQDVSATYLQPFLSFTTRTYTTFGVNTESTYDWKAEQWSVPVNFLVSQMFKVGQQIMSLQVGVRHWADSPPNGPEGTGYRVQLTFLFPK
jgi:hypothetical protein